MEQSKDEEKKVTAKVYATEEELARIAEIADDCHISMADLIRETVLYKKFSHIGTPDNADLDKLRNQIAEEESLLHQMIDRVRQEDRFGQFEEKTNLCEERQKEIAEVYAALRKKITAKRARVVRYVATIYAEKLKKEADPYTMYSETAEKRTRQFSVQMTETELKQARSLADDHDCSISCLLKKEVLDAYKNGRIPVRCDGLDKVNAELAFELNFLRIFQKEETIDDVIMQQLVEIVTEIRDTLQTVTVETDYNAARRAAREAIRRKDDNSILTNTAYML